MYIFFRTTFFVIVASLLMTACGGGGSDGAESAPPILEAVIDVNNEEQLATAATEGVIQSYKEAYLNRKTLDELIGDETCTTGSITDNYNAVNGSGYINYDQCDTSVFVYDGRVNVSVSISGDIATWSLDYVNFQINSSSIEMDVSCETIISTDKTTCTYSAVSTGLDNRSYTMSNATVTGSVFSGYTISAKVIDPNHGSASISTNSPVYILTCNDLQPSSGEIQFTDGDGKVVTVTYDSCASYTVTHSGVSNTYNW